MPKFIINSMFDNLFIKFDYKNFLFLIFIFSTTISYSQQSQYKITGTVVDNEMKPLRGARISISPLSDSNKVKGALSITSGKFAIENISSNTYKLEIRYVGFEDYNKIIEVKNKDIELNEIMLKQSVIEQQNITVTGVMVRQEQKEDTTIFNAGAFKVNPDATTEDLIKKMPGVIVERDGTVKAQGEDVKKVLVDGKEFFGDDPSTALKSLPADIIDKIQVFDRSSEQAQFTGFDDGNAQKTLNIITKSNKVAGNFGKVYGGYGTIDRFWAGGNINYFDEDFRLSVIGLSNNINQQNFAMQDLVGSSSVSSAPRGGGGGMRPQGSGGGGGSFRGMGGAGNFFVGQQNGINQTNSLGINYSDKFGKDLTISGSYFINNSNNDNNSILERNYYAQNDIIQIYNEDNNSHAENYNHRFNARIEYNIDSNNSIFIRPAFNYQANQLNSSIFGETEINSQKANETENSYISDLSAYNFQNTLLYRLKLPKKGRTFSAELQTELKENSGKTNLNSVNRFFLEGDEIVEYNQNGDIQGNGYSINADVSYTEPITENSMLEFEYEPAFTVSNSNKKIYNISDSLANESIDSTYSNNFNNEYIQQTGGISYQYRTEKSNFSIGLDYQASELNSKQYFPDSIRTSYLFTNFLPNARYHYNFSKTTNLRIFYRASTSSPSISQLQNVIDNSNPLQLRTGNPDLKQNYSHRFVTRLGNADPHTSSSVFGFAMLNITNDYIGNSTFTALSDTTIDNIFLPAGSQLTKPVNLDGNVMVRSFFTYGLPLSFIQSNFNFNGGVSYIRTPGLINSVKNFANNYGFNGGFVLSSNISTEVDFTFSYNGNYSIVKNTILPGQDNNYYSHVLNASINWIFWNGFVLNTEVFHNLYNGLKQDFNQEFLLWNASFGYKFLENKAAEIRLSVYDILGQNNSLSRNVTEIYLEDLQTQVLRRYFMLTFTYNLKKFDN